MEAINTMHSVGLVLEGGGMRGSYTLGILDVLLENKLYFPYVIGVSAGACNAASYGSRQHFRGQYIQETYITDPRYLSLRNLFSRGRSLYGMDFIFRDIPASLVPFDFDTFYATGTHTVVGVTDIRTGLPVYIDTPPRETYNQYLRASSSIPLFSPIVEVDGKHYLDGGVAAAIPVQEALRHCQKAVVILTRTRDYVKSPTRGKALLRTALRKYPNLVSLCESRHIAYNKTRALLRELESQGRIFAFYPDEMSVSVFEKDPAKLHAVYEQGRAHALTRLDDLRAFLSDSPLLDR